MGDEKSILPLSAEVTLMTVQSSVFFTVFLVDTCSLYMFPSEQYFDFFHMVLDHIIIAQNMHTLFQVKWSYT
jgi:hypothetical protein